MSSSVSTRLIPAAARRARQRSRAMTRGGAVPALGAAQREQPAPVEPACRQATASQPPAERRGQLPAACRSALEQHGLADQGRARADEHDGPRGRRPRRMGRPKPSCRRRPGREPASKRSGRRARTSSKRTAASGPKRHDVCRTSGPRLSAIRSDAGASHASWPISSKRSRSRSSTGSSSTGATCASVSRAEVRRASSTASCNAQPASLPVS